MGKLFFIPLSILSFLFISFNLYGSALAQFKLAVEKGNEKKAIRIIEKNKIEVNQRILVYFNTQTNSIKMKKRKSYKKLYLNPIHLAIYYNRLALLLTLIEFEAEVESRSFLVDDDFNDYDQATPLHFAIIENNFTASQFLIKIGANIESQNRWKDRPLHFAVLSSYKLTELLIQAGAETEPKDYQRNTPLHNSIFKGDLKTIKLLIDKGADLSAVNKDGNSVLHMACSSKKIEVIRYLIQQKVDINVKNNFNESPLHHAAAMSNYGITQLLIQNGADINAISNENKTPLDYACFINKKEKKREIQKIIDYLKSLGAKKGKELIKNKKLKGKL